MAGIIISEASAQNDMLYGKWQAPIKSFLEKRAEAIDQGSVAAKLFKKVNSTHWAESYGSLTAIDDFKPTPENGAYPLSGFEQGFSKTIKNYTWKNSFAISREMLEDGNLINLRKQPAGFMTSFERTRERYFAALLGGAIQGMKKVSFGGEVFDITGADEQALFSNAHKGKVSKKTIVNGFTDEFSAENLGKAATAMQNMKGDNDETLGLVPDTIVIPNIESIKSKVWTAIGSEKIPGSSNNDYNYQFGNWNVIIWPYLNDFIGTVAEPWILMDSNYCQEADVAIWQERVPLTVKSVVDENDANRWKGRARFAGGFVDFRGMLAGGLTAGGTL